MKKFLSLLGLIVILASCAKSCTKKTTSDESVLRIGTNANFPPFETIDNSGQLIGFDIDLGRALAKKLGIKAEYKEFDFDALILALKQGQIDIILSALSITPTRMKEITMIPYQGEPLTQMALLFWGEAPSGVINAQDIKKLSDKAGLKVTVQAGHYLEAFLQDEHVNIKPLAGPPEQILDLKYKKSFAAVLDIINAKKFVAEHPELKMLIIELPEDKWDLGYGIGIAKNNTKLAEKIKTAIEELKADGSIAQMEKSWVGSEPNGL